MRLRVIRWNAHEAEINRARYVLKCWLEAQGATVTCWMLDWGVRW